MQNTQNTLYAQNVLNAPIKITKKQTQSYVIKNTLPKVGQGAQPLVGAWGE